MDNRRISVSFAGEEHRQYILDMLVNSFVQFDPLVNYFSLSRDEFSSVVRPYINASIDQRFALLASDDNNGNLAGVCISHDVIMDTIHEMSLLSSRAVNYIEFFQALAAPLEIKLPVSPGLMLCAGFLAVDSKYYGANIPALINQALLEAAKTRGYQNVISEFTNPSNYYSYKRMFGGALKTVNVLAYKDFINGKNERPLPGAHGESILTIIEI